MSLHDRGYELTDAVWLEGLPIAINEDFSFETALMGGDAIGPGIAAAQRQSANTNKAALLKGTELDAATLARIEVLRSCGIRAYGLLWGGANAATLKVILEKEGEGDTIAARRAVDIATRPIAASNGWAAIGVLSDAMRTGLDMLLATTQRHSAS